MNYELDGEYVVAYKDNKEVGRARVLDKGDYYVVSELEAKRGKGLPLMFFLKRILKGKPIRFMVDYGERMPELVKMYLKLGAQVEGVQMIWAE